MISFFTFQIIPEPIRYTINIYYLHVYWIVIGTIYEVYVNKMYFLSDKNIPHVFCHSKQNTTYIIYVMCTSNWIDIQISLIRKIQVNNENVYYSWLIGIYCKIHLQWNMLNNYVLPSRWNCIINMSMQSRMTDVLGAGYNINTRTIQYTIEHVMKLIDQLFTL